MTVIFIIIDWKVFEILWHQPLFLNLKLIPSYIALLITGYSHMALKIQIMKKKCSQN